MLMLVLIRRGVSRAEMQEDVGRPMQTCCSVFCAVRSQMCSHKGLSLNENVLLVVTLLE